MDVAELNGLRRTVRRMWEAGERPTPLVHLSDEEGDRAGVGQAFQTLCSEIGVRHVRLDLGEGLTAAHRDTIAKTARHPRMIVITRIDGLAESDRPGFHDMLCRDASRTFPVIVCFAPDEDVQKTKGAWARLKELEAVTRRYDEAPAADTQGVGGAAPAIDEIPFD